MVARQVAHHVWHVCRNGTDTCSLCVYVLRCQSNFATVDEGSGVVVRRRADRQFEREGPVLCAALDNLEILGYPLYRVNVRWGETQYNLCLGFSV